MNNKIQQRFDKSIHDAVEAEKIRRETATQAICDKARAEAMRLLPATERLIIAGEYKGQKLPAERIDALKSIRSQYRRALGLTVDRKLLDMPTNLQEATK